MRRESATPPGGPANPRLQRRRKLHIMTSARKLEHFSKIFETLGLFLPGSPYYSTLSSLPPPDRTNPTATTTFITQTAIQNSLPILEEMLGIQENKDTKQAAEELERRRRRLDAPPREQLKRQITCEISAASKVNSKKRLYVFLSLTQFRYRFRSSIAKLSTTQIRQMICADQWSPGSFTSITTILSLLQG